MLDGPEVATFAQSRTTYAANEDGTEDVNYGTWKGETARAVLPNRWTGETWFYLEGL